MNLDRKLDRVGPDHKIRNDFRNFLLVFRPNRLRQPALYALYDGNLAVAEDVAKELDALVSAGFSIDFVYTFSNDDIRRFANYAKNEEQIEKVNAKIWEACKLAFDAGVKHEELQEWIVENYDILSARKDFHYRFDVKPDENFKGH